MNNLKAIFYPNVPFKSLFIPHILREIYLDKAYEDVVKNKKDMVIIDVGANIGLVTHYLRDFAKVVYAIEPASEHYNALVKNIEFNEWTNVKPFQLAMADIDGEMALKLNKWNKTCHSLRVGSKGETIESVKTLSFASFMKQNNIEGVDFVKFDVEGAEELILMSRGFTSIAHKIKAIEIEFHFKDYQKLVDHMIRLGFSAKKIECSAIVYLFTR